MPAITYVGHVLHCHSQLKLWNCRTSPVPAPPCSSSHREAMNFPCQAWPDFWSFTFFCWALRSFCLIFDSFTTSPSSVQHTGVGYVRDSSSPRSLLNFVASLMSEVWPSTADRSLNLRTSSIVGSVFLYSLSAPLILMALYSSSTDLRPRPSCSCDR